MIFYKMFLIFDIYFKYFIESQVQNNHVKENNGGGVGNMNGNIYNEKKGHKNKSSNKN